MRTMDFLAAIMAAISFVRRPSEAGAAVGRNVRNAQRRAGLLHLDHGERRPQGQRGAILLIGVAWADRGWARALEREPPRRAAAVLPLGQGRVEPRQVRRVDPNPSADRPNERPGDTCGAVLPAQAG